MCEDMQKERKAKEEEGGEAGFFGWSQCGKVRLHKQESRVEKGGGGRVVVPVGISLAMETATSAVWCQKGVASRDSSVA